MTRKDFNAIAAIIAAAKHNDNHTELAHDMATYCASANPNFNYRRFIAACGIED